MWGYKYTETTPILSFGDADKPDLAVNTSSISTLKRAPDGNGTIITMQNGATHHVASSVREILDAMKESLDGRKFDHRS
jgi:uncharacterized protein YlzI (FlbEa/FlbD family)